MRPIREEPAVERGTAMKFSGWGAWYASYMDGQLMVVWGPATEDRARDKASAWRNEGKTGARAHSSNPEHPNGPGSPIRHEYAVRYSPQPSGFKAASPVPGATAKVIEALSRHVPAGTSDPRDWPLLRPLINQIAKETGVDADTVESVVYQEINQRQAARGGSLKASALKVGDHVDYVSHGNGGTGTLIRKQGDIWLVKPDGSSTTQVWVEDRDLRIMKDSLKASSQGPYVSKRGINSGFILDASGNHVYSSNSFVFVSSLVKKLNADPANADKLLREAESSNPGDRAFLMKAQFNHESDFDYQKVLAHVRQFAGELRRIRDRDWDGYDQFLDRMFNTLRRRLGTEGQNLMWMIEQAVSEVL